MNNPFNEVKGKLGFGLMRLPSGGKEEAYDEIKAMADEFIAAGFNYFDTAHGYLEGLSEIAMRECVSKRYPREKFVLADKLSETFFNTREEIRPFLLSQLKACGVEYFDFYLMHAQCARNYVKYQECKAYETAFELKREGLVRHVGLSFHDDPSVLDRILNDHPEVEFVQLQFNYADYDDAGVQSRKCYDVARKHGKPVIVMEPVKGGTLVNLPEKALNEFKVLGGGSAASYAVRYAAGFDGVFMVLSGMSSLAQMHDNVSYMRDFKPLDAHEKMAVENVKRILRGMDAVACTACRYCVDGCPKAIPIPDVFADYNNKKLHKNWNSVYYYGVHTSGKGKASDCIKCGKCENACPQHLPIRELLLDAAKEMEEKEETGD